MALHEILLAFLTLQFVMALIMAVFPRDEVMRSKTGISSFTPKPKSIGDYVFNGLVLFISGGALFMEYINDRIVKKPWLMRVGIRIMILLGALFLAFIFAALISI
ncbi:hypothetical protein [Marinicrinis lubricantis]|uniref:Uncharacterized protein n=1 Tax=Marinicrinis lubricantis TaxID=2086470 RepID=A0ABW1IQK4_9BACL